MGNERKIKKTVVIGIDGLDIDSVTRWLDAKSAPNIWRIVFGGARARLESVVPTNSASAWSSMITGRSPAGHGVFGFTRSCAGLLKRSTVRSDDIGAPPLWEIAAIGGAGVGMVNCPMTWPPPAMNGFAISGIPIPRNELYAWPPDVESALRKRFGTYIVDLPWADLNKCVPGEREEFLDGIYRMTKKREDVALWTMKNLAWDVYMIVFTGSDRMFHSYWHHADPTHPMHDKAAAAIFGDEIRKYLILVDEIVGRLLETAGAGTPALLVSDHGFGALHKRFNIARWLEKRGYLARLDPDAPSDELDAELDEPLRRIDWDNTVAYPASLSESGIWINRADRQERGIVDDEEYEMLCERIAGELLDTDFDGARPVEKVYRRDEILAGPYIEEAPDLLIIPRDKFIIDDGAAEAEISPSIHETATHRRHGIFSVFGDEFKKGVELSDMRIVDVMPTLLATAGLPIPDGLEGSPALEAFAAPPEIVKSGVFMPNRPRRDPDDSTEEDAMKKQLKGLGYL